jgi:hypothetical protein
MQTLDQINCLQCGSPHIAYCDGHTIGAGNGTLTNGALLICESCGTRFKFRQIENPVRVSAVASVTISAIVSAVAAAAKKRQFNSY